MGEVKFVDTTFRDGNQSLWGATGLTTGNILSIASDMDNAGFKAIELTSSIHMGIGVRYHKENPWEKMRLIAQAIKKTPLIFGTTGRRFIGFKRMPDSIMSLVMERVAANGIRRVWILDAAHEVNLFHRTARLAKSVAKELGSRGIRANAIAPGFIITEMTGALSEEVRNEWAKQIPLRRGGTPEDVANVALFLASDLSSYVSGQVINVCGGMNT